MNEFVRISTKFHNHQRSESISPGKTIQTRSSGQIEMREIGKTSSIAREGISSSQEYRKEIATSGDISNFTIKELSFIESSPGQVHFLPQLMTRDDVKNRLLEFEKKYNISSEEFYSKWKQGEAVDSLDSLKWVTLFELWNENYLI